MCLGTASQKQDLEMRQTCVPACIQVWLAAQALQDRHLRVSCAGQKACQLYLATHLAHARDLDHHQVRRKHAAVLGQADDGTTRVEDARLAGGDVVAQVAVVPRREGLRPAP